MVSLNSIVVQVFELERLQTGCYVRIDFHQRQTRQPGDSLYYTCVERIRIRGVANFEFKETKLAVLESALRAQLGDFIVAPRNSNLQRIEQSISLVKKSQLTKWVEVAEYLNRDSFCRQEPFWEFFWNQLLKNNESPTEWFKTYLKRMFSLEKRLNRDESMRLARYTFNGLQPTLIERGIRLHLVISG